MHRTTDSLCHPCSYQVSYSKAVRLFPQSKQTLTISGADTLICGTSSPAGIGNPSVMTAYVANYTSRLAAYCILMTIRPFSQGLSVTEKWFLLYCQDFDQWISATNDQCSNCVDVSCSRLSTYIEYCVEAQN